MFKDKVAVITGGGGILCSAFAKELARLGAKVAVLDLRLEAAQKVADAINGQGGQAKAYQADVLDKENMEALRQQIRKDLGFCDILINGAGGNSPKGNTTNDTFSFEDMKNDNVVTFFDLKDFDIDNVFRLNFLGAFIATQVFVKDMLDKGGSIINISSMSAFSPMTRVSAYSAAKAAISNFTMWLAVHFAPANIRVNAIAPGFFDTAQNHDLLFNKDGTPTKRTEKILNNTPMRRLGKVEDLLGAVKFLCNDKESAFITGIVLPVDGGFQAYSGV
ncbi:MAG: SDR family oxidoreductase [Christensenellales bacterium]|jgi:NAD(P)-dependent dehydrogenase (short-subunit alcohol dehydrogenase family)|nr:SDR family oxidoreductase [Clostridiales bacterium]